MGQKRAKVSFKFHRGSASLAPVPLGVSQIAVPPRTARHTLSSPRVVVSSSEANAEPAFADPQIDFYWPARATMSSCVSPGVHRHGFEETLRVSGAKSSLRSPVATTTNSARGD